MQKITIPPHLKRYIVQQNYRQYTAQDQAVYRYIMRQLKDLLSRSALPPYYLKGLKETGITIDRIPRISHIDKKLQKYGLRAVPVSGFIPPTAFVEFQLNHILPIASALRTAQHISYTPAPDIIHEAGGHAPFLIHPVFNSFLRKYALVALKAITNKQDFQQYSAIRSLSDIKENPLSTPQQIQQAEKHLHSLKKKMQAPSESAKLSRFIWWTSEYGLIGKGRDKKIYGAGLLSSIGEAKACLSPKVKKIPLTAECVEYSYDITRYQPQLFVTPNFETLHTVLQDLTKDCAFYRGGEYGLKKALVAGTVCSIELNTGLQMSGVVESFNKSRGKIAFIKLKGPCQLSYQNKQLRGHGTKIHFEGFSAPLGHVKGLDRCLSQTSVSEIKKLYVGSNGKIKLHFASGYVLEGQYISAVLKNRYPILIRFKDCRVYRGNKVYYRPEWGVFDLALGDRVLSVFGGAADRLAFKEDLPDFDVSHVPLPVWTKDQKKVFALHNKIRKVRETKNRAVFLKLVQKYHSGANGNPYQGLAQNHDQRKGLRQKCPRRPGGHSRANGNLLNQKNCGDYLIKMELLELALLFKNHKIAGVLKKELLKTDKAKPQLFIKNAIKLL